VVSNEIGNTTILPQLLLAISAFYIDGGIKNMKN